MIRRTCTSHRAADGSYWLEPRRGGGTGEAVELRGPWVPLWESLLPLAELPTVEQRAVLRSMPRAERARLVRAVALFRRAGLLAFRRSEEATTPGASSSPTLHKLHLEVTYGCNFRCEGCYLGARLLSPGRARTSEAPTDRWLRLIAEAGDLGCSFATVTGGEPFLRPDLFTLLEALTDQAIVVEINTNASAITERSAEALRSFLVSAVAVSVYGYDEPSSLAYTGNRASLESTLRGIGHLAARKLPVSVKYFATRETRSGYEAVAERLRPLGVPVALVGHVIHGDVFEGSPRDHLLADWDEPPVVQPGPLPCFPAGTVLNVEPDGTVRPCSKLSVSLGNAFEQGLAEIWKRTARVDHFRDFWVGYCRDEGFVPGSSHAALCPGSALLSRPGGLSGFRRRWEGFSPEARRV